MHNFGLVGKPLGHSFSKTYFESQHFANADYLLFEPRSISEITDWVAANHIEGFNVTSPYKKAILPLLDQIDETAAAIGAVNCVVVCDGLLTGHNTDALALLQLLRPQATTFGSARILGTGGAAQAVHHAMQQLGIAHHLVSRTPQRTPLHVGYDTLPQWLATASAHNRLLLLNATPVGMPPIADCSPLPCAEQLSPHVEVFDLIYNPSPTLLLRQAAAHGCTTHDGLALLHGQAQHSYTLWGLHQHTTL